MTIAARLKQFLNAHHIGYHILCHARTMDLHEAIEDLHIPAYQCAHSVGLIDEKGIMIAVIPLDSRLDLTLLNKQLRRHFKIAPRLTLDKLFYDCEPGSHPALAEPYGVSMVVDKALMSCQDIYISPGSHSSLLKINKEDFCYLTANQKHRSISYRENQAQVVYS